MTVAMTAVTTLADAQAAGDADSRRERGKPAATGVALNRAAGFSVISGPGLGLGTERLRIQQRGVDGPGVPPGEIAWLSRGPTKLQTAVNSNTSTITVTTTVRRLLRKQSLGHKGDVGRTSMHGGQ